MLSWTGNRFGLVYTTINKPNEDTNNPKSVNFRLLGKKGNPLKKEVEIVPYDPMAHSYIENTNLLWLDEEFILTWRSSYANKDSFLKLKRFDKNGNSIAETKNIYTSIPYWSDNLDLKSVVIGENIAHLFTWRPYQKPQDVVFFMTNRKGKRISPIHTLDTKHEYDYNFNAGVEIHYDKNAKLIEAYWTKVVPNTTYSKVISATLGEKGNILKGRSPICDEVGWSYNNPIIIAIHDFKLFAFGAMYTPFVTKSYPSSNYIYYQVIE